MDSEEDISASSDSTAARADRISGRVVRVRGSGLVEVEASGPAVFSVTAMLWIAREVSVGVRLKVNTA